MDPTKIVNILAAVVAALMLAWPQIKPLLPKLFARSERIPVADDGDAVALLTKLAHYAVDLEPEKRNQVLPLLDEAKGLFE